MKKEASAIVTATGRGLFPRPPAMSDRARLERVCWFDGPIRCHYAGEGFWWCLIGLQRGLVKTCAPFDAGAELTIYWTEEAKP